MTSVGPFETDPLVAVAVSGGADSLALALLAQEWARGEGGAIVALTVDHGLRREAAAEARRVGRWLAARGIAHHVLRRRGPRPAGDVQAAARAARYELLARWCRRHGVLHLAVAHHREDQAETLLQRLARGSGLDGLAAMAAVVELASVRVVRPLLAVGRERLRATLTARGQDWIEDPSNADTAFSRVRLRRLLPLLAREGMDAGRLAAASRHLGRARAALDDAVAELLGAGAELCPAGYLRLDPRAFAAAPREVSLRALARCVMTVGGGAYTPRLQRLERLHAAVVGAAALSPRTLGGCRILAHGGRILVCREAAQAAAEARVRPGDRVHWDGRFDVRLLRRAGDGGGVVLRRLGAEGWAAVAAAAPGLRASPIPPAARPGLPALWDRAGVLAVPHLGYRRPGAAAAVEAAAVVFRPRHPLAGARFTVA